MIFLNNMATPKTHLCQDCGEINPHMFYPKTKGRCKQCTSTRRLQQLNDDPIAKQLNKERAAQWQRDNPIRFRWLQAKSRAARKGIDFEITEEHILTAYEQQSGVCAYTGVDLTMECSTSAPHAASIDRIDSTKGYTPDNVVLCCAVINSMKNDMSVDELKEWAARLYHTLHRE